MSKSLNLASEQAQSQCLRSARRAIRAGDLSAADKWLKLAERHWRLCEHVRLQTDRNAVERRERWLRNQARERVGGTRSKCESAP